MSKGKAKILIYIATASSVSGLILALSVLVLEPYIEEMSVASYNALVWVGTFLSVSGLGCVTVASLGSKLLMQAGWNWKIVVVFVVSCIAVLVTSSLMTAVEATSGLIGK